jgi:hypothetical protein
MTVPRVLFFAAVLLTGCSSDHAPNRGHLDAGSADSGVAPEAAVKEAGPIFDASVEAAPDTSTTGPGYPELLSKTGLFADILKDTLGAGVAAYQPKYVLWSDGATKRRWLYLPPGKQIDTSDMDFWNYPVGTKAWKEFTVNGQRIETRMQYKRGVGDWVMIAYHWNAAGTDAEAVPDGVVDADGTQHDIPAQSDCQFCHGNMVDKLLGVTAIQLSHTLGGTTISDLIAEHRLSDPPAKPFQIPGSAVAEQALGYLHANCGNCHNPNSNVAVSVALRLWESTSQLDTVEHTTAYETAIDQPNSVLPQFHIIEPGRPNRSELFLRISTRGVGGIVTQMPPIGTKVVDPVGIAKIKAWIQSLPPMSDGGAEGGVRSEAGTGG